MGNAESGGASAPPPPTPSGAAGAREAEAFGRACDPTEQPTGERVPALPAERHPAGEPDEDVAADFAAFSQALERLPDLDLLNKEGDEHWWESADTELQAFAREDAAAAASAYGSSSEDAHGAALEGLRAAAREELEAAVAHGARLAAAHAEFKRKRREERALEADGAAAALRDLEAGPRAEAARARRRGAEAAARRLRLKQRYPKSAGYTSFVGDHRTCVALGNLQLESLGASVTLEAHHAGEPSLKLRVAGALAGDDCARIVVRLEQLALLGDAVPNIEAEEITLDVAFSLRATVVFSDGMWMLGPQDATRFDVGSLRQVSRGRLVQRDANDVCLPLPVLPDELLRTICNAALPLVVQARIVDTLPPELGDYLADSRQGVYLEGAIRVAGSSLDGLDANVCAEDEEEEAARDAKKKGGDAAAASAPHAAARATMGLTSVEQARRLASLLAGWEGAGLPGGPRVAQDVVDLRPLDSVTDLLGVAPLRSEKSGLGVAPGSLCLGDLVAFRRRARVEFGVRGLRALELLWQRHTEAVEPDIDVLAAFAAARDFAQKRIRVTVELRQATLGVSVLGMVGLAIGIQRRTGAQRDGDTDLAALEERLREGVSGVSSAISSAAATLKGRMDSFGIELECKDVSVEGPLKLNTTLSTRSWFDFRQQVGLPPMPVAVGLQPLRGGALRAHVFVPSDLVAPPAGEDAADEGDRLKLQVPDPLGESLERVAVADVHSLRTSVVVDEDAIVKHVKRLRAEREAAGKQRGFRRGARDVELAAAQTNWRDGDLTIDVGSLPTTRLRLALEGVATRLRVLALLRLARRLFAALVARLGGEPEHVGFVSTIFRTVERYVRTMALRVQVELSVSVQGGLDDGDAVVALVGSSRGTERPLFAQGEFALAQVWADAEALEQDAKRFVAHLQRARGPR